MDHHCQYLPGTADGNYFDIALEGCDEAPCGKVAHFKLMNIVDFEEGSALPHIWLCAEHYDMVKQKSPMDDTNK